MGSWFSNLHIRKKEKITRESVCDCIKGNLSEKKYTLVECEQDADVVVAVLDVQNSEWISVCSQVFAHDDPDSCKEVAAPFFDRLQTDVMGISCFDSDYLYLNLINTAESADAWIGIGSGKEMGIKRRNNLTAWKKKVANYPAFSEAVKNKYICADEFLAEAECSLGLPAEQGSISLDYLQDTALQKDAVFLYFRQEEGSCRTGPDLRICYLHHALPCFDGRENSVFFLNFGEESRGLSVYFLGPYVEHDEITFSDVKIKRQQCPVIEMELQKCQLLDGQWAYRYHDSEIVVPPGIPRRIDRWKRYMLQQERMYKISFVPHGNPRKMLDITVVIIPDGKTDNQAEWNVWHQHGSKEGFIKQHNKIWKRLREFEEPGECLPLLKVKDFEE